MRIQIAKKENVKPELIFSDKSLYDMMKKNPSNKDEFLSVFGVDEFRCQKYGQDFIEVLNTLNDFYNNDLLFDLESKPVVKKDTKEETYDLFQNKKMSIKQISKVRGIRTSTVEDHLVTLYRKSYKLDMERLGFNNDVFEKIKGVILKLPKGIKLRLIKDKLPNTINYLHIKMTMVKMNS